MKPTEFLLACIAEDEAKAHDAAEASARAANWEYGGQGQLDDRVKWIGFNQLGTSPRRVLAECEAKRRIVELHCGSGITCPRCSLGTESGQIVFEREPCETLRALALPYADHPDFDPAWRP